MSVSIERAGAVLTVDLDAIVSNWLLLRGRLRKAECAAVVKADAYGLGAAEIAGALQTAGCRSFFVAHIEEALALGKAVGSVARIFVLNGTPPETEPDFVAAGLIPVVNTLRELSGWRRHAQKTGAVLPVALQVDSGMSRLGLPPLEIATIGNDPVLLDGLSVCLVMSHLACADEPMHSANGVQRQVFERLRATLPGVPASLANSSGVFLGEDFHFDLVRPGAALYGINPTPGEANPMRPVLHLSARVVQLREVPAGTGVGYGHAASTTRPSPLATISLGYADGWPRNAPACAFFNGNKLPLVGRVSMDSIVLDAAGAPGLREGDLVDLICGKQTVDEVAQAAGTIGYEILSRLGRRFHRRHIRLGQTSQSERITVTGRSSPVADDFQ